MRCLLLACVVIVGCGDDLRPAARPDGRPRIDARVTDAIDMDGEGIPDANSDAATDAAAPATLDCTSYCDVIQSACTGANEQYESATDCMRACMYTPTGSLGMTTTNTLGCRLAHAETAANTPATAATECPKAGPAGDGTCGATCEAFCGIIDDICPGQWSTTLCSTQCLAKPAITGTYSTASTTGNTRECRLYWATVGTCANTTRNSNPVCQ